MIEVQGFRKTFFVGLRRKRFQAAKEITFRVEEREIFGFLGPNGAGKTTTIKALMGLIRPDGGALKLFGRDVAEGEWRRSTGYMPEHPTFYDFLTSFELVSWFGRLFGLSRHEADEEAKRHLGRVGLGHALHRRLRSYSKGMLQRAGLAQALIGGPKLLILDEPMTGLDPLGRKDMRELILELRDEGRTIFYSTHILPDIEMTCDRVSIIHNGATRRTGRLDEILGETTKGVSVVVGKLDAEHAGRIREEFPSAAYSGGALQIEFSDIERAQRFLSEALASGAELIRFEPHRESLESIFVRTLGEAAAVDKAEATERT